MTNQFTPLHLHTDYSMLDGLAKIPEYIKRGVELGIDHMAITDHGTIAGWWEWYVECMKAGINPILGLEAYFVPNAAKVREKVAKEDSNEKTAKRFHVTLLARNADGAKILIELLTEAHRQFYYKPLIDWRLLEALGDEADNLVCLSGCAASIISRKLTGKDPDAGYREAKRWKKVFRHFYIETMHHGSDIDVPLNGALLELAGKLKLKHVITNDSHYVHKEDHKHHDALLAIQTASDIDDPSRFSFDGRGYHLRDRAEIKKAYRAYDQSVFRQGIRNTRAVAEACRIRIPEWDNKSWHIPDFPKLPEETTADRFLRRLALRGLRKRGLDNQLEYVERTEQELRDIKKAGIANFLLISWEAIRWAKKRGRVGPGRGSICGCLVAYLIGIHALDSIKYGLMFERFLNPERPKAPDIDSDFEPWLRPLVMEHYIDLYGEENVMRVAAFQTMGVAGCFQTLARAHGMSPEERNRWTKELGVFEKRDDEDEDVGEEEDISVLPEEIRDNYPGLANQMRHLLGTKRAISRHAGGILIFQPGDPIRDYVGLQWLPKKDAPNGGNWAASYDLKTVEGMMLLKQDTLGLRTLSTIEECVKMIKANHDVALDVNSWVPDEEPGDDKVYQMLAEGRSGGVFQAEGGSLQKGLMEVRPTCYADIAAATALYRKGPIMAGAPNRFLKNKRDGKVRVAHSSLKPILAPTWGEMIYDEQMFQILNECAGFSWARVDDAKNAMKKKDPELMAPLKEEAIKGFRRIAGMSKKEAGAVWKMIGAQTAYLFNKSHSYAYSRTTYITARLKCLYPLEYMTALVRTVKPDKAHLKKRMGYVGELAEMEFRIKAPTINESDAKATCGYDDAGNGWFQFGFIDCKGIGESKAAKILEAREAGDTYGFFSVDDVKAVLDKGAVAVLTAIGALKKIGGPKGKSKQKELVLGWRFKDPMKKYRSKWASRVIFPTENNQTVMLVGEITEIERRKTKDDDPFVIWTLQWAPGRTWRITLWQDADDVWFLRRGSIVKVNGKWQMKFGNLAIGSSDHVHIIREVA
jgi:DNA polymerase III subunit alpha